MNLIPDLGFREQPRIEHRLLEINVPLIEVDGDLVFQHYDLLAQALAAYDISAGPILDLTDCRFVDSTTVGFFVKFHKILASQGLEFGLVVPPGVVRRSLEISRLDRVLHLYPSVDAAVSARRAAAA